MLPEYSVDAMEPLVRTALQTARLAVVEDPGDADAWAHLGYCLAAHQLEPQGEQALAQALRIDDSDPKAAYMYALLGEINGSSPADLTKRFEHAILLRPEDAVMHVRLGDAQMQAGAAAAALESHERALQLDPGFLRARLGRGRALISRGRAEEALTDLRAVAQRAPSDRATHVALAQALTLSHHPVEASKVSARAQSLSADTLPWVDPLRNEVTDLAQGSSANFKRAERFLRAGNASGAAAEFQRVLAARPDDTYVRIRLVQVQIGLDLLTAARDNLSVVLKADPEHPGAHCVLGILDVQAGDFAPGIAHFERAAAKVPRLDEPSYRAWGQGLAYYKRWREAAECYVSLVDLDPERGEPHLLAALAYREAGDMARARECFSNGKRLAPTHKLVIHLDSLLR